MSKKLLIGILIVVVLAGAAAAVAIRAASGATEVGVEEVTRDTLSVTVSAAGTLGADSKTDMYPPASTTIASILVTDGDAVKKGDLIATLDIAPLELQLAQAQAAYDAALAQADAASAATPSSTDKEAASAAVTAAYSAYEVAVAQYEAAVSAAPSQAAIDSAQSQVDYAQTMYDSALQLYEEFEAANPEPRDSATETTLMALGYLRDQAYANLLSAQAALAQLIAAQTDETAATAAKAAKDQAWAAYLAALSQQAQLTGTPTSAARASADSGVEAARLALELAVKNLENADMRAPADGTVVFNSATSSISLLGGDTSSSKPAVGSAVSPASAPFSIVIFDELLFSAQVDEADVTAIEQGQPAYITLDAMLGEVFETTIDRVEKTSVLTSTGGTAFSVLMRLEGLGDRALLGMNGSVDIETDSLGDSITVPVESVLGDDDEYYVYVVEDDQAVRVDVSVGTFTDTRVEILDGLAIGDKVITDGLRDLVDGTPVRVK